MRLHLGAVAITFIFQACITAYEPPIQSDLAYLVIDGFLNNGPDSTIITLTRSQPLAATTAPPPVVGAVVQIQDDQHNIFALSDNKHVGKYSFYGISLPTDRTYRLYIRVGEKEYVSEYVPVKITPPIDSVFWNLETNYGVKGIRFYVSTHDSEHRTDYYRWDYTETWDYHANQESLWMLVGRTNMIPRPPSLQIYTCWQNLIGTEVFLKNTNNLSEDIVDRFPLNFAKLSSYRFSDRYSLLVNQYALTKDEYLYWQQVKKNSENIGGIFGPIPSQTVGNYTCVTESSEPVIGYFSFTNKQSQRIEVSPYDLPPINSYDESISDSCKVQWAEIKDIRKMSSSSYYIFLQRTDIDLNDQKTLFSFTDPVCADCRLLGGKTTKPDFW